MSSSTSTQRRGAGGGAIKCSSDSTRRAQPVDSSSGANQEPRADRESLAVGLLLDGHANAFVEFFELTAAAASPPSGDAKADSGSGSSGGQVPLAVLSAELARADAALATDAPDACAAGAALLRLASHFEAAGDLQRAALLLEQSARHAADAGWRNGELQAGASLGRIYERLGRPDEAPAAATAAASAEGEAAAGVKEEQIQTDQIAAEARAALVRVFSMQAAAFERAGDSSSAESTLRRCLAAAAAIGDAAAAAAAHHRLGLLCAAAQRWQEASQEQAACLTRARASKDSSSSSGGITAGISDMEGAATRAYAKALAHLGDTAGAVAALESFVAALGGGGGEQQQPGNGDDAGGGAQLPPAAANATRSAVLAMCQLGALHYARADAAAAVAAFERAWAAVTAADGRSDHSSVAVETTQQLPTPAADGQLRDAVRFNLGAARAALRLREAAAATAKGDVPALMALKTAAAVAVL